MNRRVIWAIVGLAALVACPANLVAQFPSEVVSFEDDGRSVRWVIRAPDSLAKYIAHKGSICVDGTSLTVNAVNGA